MLQGPGQLRGGGGREVLRVCVCVCGYFAGLESWERLSLAWKTCLAGGRNLLHFVQNGADNVGRLVRPAAIDKIEAVRRRGLVGHRERHGGQQRRGTFGAPAARDRDKGAVKHLRGSGVRGEGGERVSNLKPNVNKK